MYLGDEKKNRINLKKHGISFEEARDSIFEGSNIFAPEIAYSKGGQDMRSSANIAENIMWEFSR